MKTLRGMPWRGWVVGLSLLSTGHAWGAAPNKKEALIQIGVEVVEVDEQKMQNLGIQWLSSLHVEEPSVPPLFKVGTFTRGQLFADLQALLTEGAADLLANPKLVTRDGTTASFHAGGELPYATSSGSGSSVSVEFKSYGVNLKINPHIDEDNRIVMSVEAEVSGPDDQNSVTLSGNTVPGIRSRKVSSDLTLDPGSTLTMAGMIQNQRQWVRTGVPGLMSIPLLGRLFSEKTEKKLQTSIVVFVTPTILSSSDIKPSAPSDTSPAHLEQSPEAKANTPDELMDALDAVEKIHG